MIDYHFDMGAEDLDSKSKLIQVAGRLFAEKGFDGVSTRDIAGAAQVNISLISYYFQGKEGLYKAVIEDFALQAQGELHRRLDEINKIELTKESYVQIMSGIIRAVLAMKEKYPYMSSLMYRELISGLPYAREIHENIFAGMCEKLTALMEVAQKKKIIRKDVNLLISFISMMHAIDGYYLMNKCNTSISNRCLKVPEKADQYAEQIVKIFIEGVLV